MRSLHTSTFAIGLFGDRLEVALWRYGSVVASRHRTVALDRHTDIEQWCGAVRELAPLVREFVDEIACESGSRPRRAHVVYTSPSAVGDCMYFPVRTPSQAASAAALAVTDSMQCLPDSVVSASLFIERTAARASAVPVASGSSSPNANDGRSQGAHVVVAADCELALAAVQSTVEAAGLRFSGAVPMQAVIAASAFSQSGRPKPVGPDAEERSEGEELSRAPIAHFHIGEAGSFLLIRDAQRRTGGRGNLRFTRSIPIGTSALAAALMRRADAKHEDERTDRTQPDQRLDADAARRAIFEFGLPTSPDEVHEPTGLTVRDVLPLVQPLVQRMTVELRQSLRFALDAAERTRASIIVSGSGAAVPGLATALGRDLDAAVLLQHGNIMKKADDEVHVAACPTDLGEAVRAWGSRSALSIDDLALLPRELSLRLSTARFQRGFWAGAAAALVLIGFDAARLASQLAHVELDQQETAASVHPSNVAKHSPFFATVEQDPNAVFELIESARQFRAAVDRETNRRIDFRASLHELSQIASGSVRFTNINFQPAEAAGHEDVEGASVTIAGVAAPAADIPARNEIERFVHEMRQSPIFDRVSLGNVFVESVDSPNRGFEVRFFAQAAPAHAHQLDESRSADEIMSTEVVSTPATTERRDE